MVRGWREARERGEKIEEDAPLLAFSSPLILGNGERLSGNTNFMAKCGKLSGQRRDYSELSGLEMRAIPASNQAKLRESFPGLSFEGYGRVDWFAVVGTGASVFPVRSPPLILL